MKNKKRKYSELTQEDKKFYDSFTCMADTITVYTKQLKPIEDRVMFKLKNKYGNIIPLIQEEELKQIYEDSITEFFLLRDKEEER